MGVREGEFVWQKEPCPGCPLQSGFHGREGSAVGVPVACVTEAVRDELGLEHVQWQPTQLIGVVPCGQAVEDAQGVVRLVPV